MNMAELKAELNPLGNDKKTLVLFSATISTLPILPTLLVSQRTRKTGRQNRRANKSCSHGCAAPSDKTPLSPNIWVPKNEKTCQNHSWLRSHKRAYSNVTLYKRVYVGTHSFTHTLEACMSSCVCVCVCARARARVYILN